MLSQSGNPFCTHPDLREVCQVAQHQSEASPQAQDTCCLIWSSDSIHCRSPTFRFCSNARNLIESFAVAAEGIIAACWQLQTAAFLFKFLSALRLLLKAVRHFCRDPDAASKWAMEDFSSLRKQAKTKTSAFWSLQRWIQEPSCLAKFEF